MSTNDKTEKLVPLRGNEGGGLHKATQGERGYIIHYIHRAEKGKDTTATTHSVGLKGKSIVPGANKGREKRTNSLNILQGKGGCYIS